MSRALDELSPEQRAELDTRIEDAENCTSYEEEMAFLIWQRDNARSLVSTQVKQCAVDVAKLMADDYRYEGDEDTRNAVIDMLDALGVEIPYE